MAANRILLLPLPLSFVYPSLFMTFPSPGTTAGGVPTSSALAILHAKKSAPSITTSQLRHSPPLIPIGALSSARHFGVTPVLCCAACVSSVPQHSYTPSAHHSNTPPLHHSTFTDIPLDITAPQPYTMLILGLSLGYLESEENL